MSLTCTFLINSLSNYIFDANKKCPKCVRRIKCANIDLSSELVRYESDRNRVR